MNNKDAIIQKIIDDANKAADDNIREAEETASQVLARAQKEVDRYLDANADKADALYADALSRSGVVANLDCKKLTLNAKKEVIAKVFDEAAAEIKADKKGYLALVEKMIVTCCDDKDEVVVCESDDKIITKKFVDDISKKVAKKLTKSSTFGDFKGGVMLVGKNYDKNLTLDLELEGVREKVESKIVEILFGGDK
ncbi:MAG: hypothetical protein K2G37_04345 [Clostridia bacterium]|nr:hypothetical protein [Clostridia bacterium]MDE7329081.1 hypothetical protein [Clostridia bacterium]